MCKILAKTKGMPREEWLRLRRKGIGGSDAGAVCGVNPYANALSVYREKTGDGDGDSENESMRQGRDLEEYVARRFTEETGLKARRSNAMYQSVEHPFMIGDVDRLIVGEDAGLECKTVSPYNADKWKDGQVPLHYVLQCLHYMVVTGRKSWYIAGLIFGREFVYRKIRYDPVLAEQLIGIEKDFWENNVRKGKMPPPDGSKVYDDILQKYFKAAKKDQAIELVGFDEKLLQREKLAAQIKELSAEQKKIEQEIKLFMRDSESAASEKYKVFWSNVNSMRLDTKKLKDEHPEIYAKYARPSASRRFEVRAA